MNPVLSQLAALVTRQRKLLADIEALVPRLEEQLSAKMLLEAVFTDFPEDSDAPVPTSPVPMDADAVLGRMLSRMQ